MAWRDQLQKATFRGVPFQWKRADTDVGRRVARHDYPLRDDSWFEDMGLSPREFTIEAYVIGPDYMVDRDKLIAALETAGPGPLAHPTLGTVQVQVLGKVRLSESTDEGGMARFTITFVVAGKAQPPAAVKASAPAVKSAAAALKTAAATDTASRLTAAKTATAAATKVSFAQKIINAVSSVTRSINAIRGSVSSVMQTISDVQNSINDLIAAPALLAQEVQGAIAELEALVESPFDAIFLYASIFDFGDDTELIPRVSASQQITADARCAMIALVKTSAIAESATASADATFANYQEAVRVRDLITTAIDAVIAPEVALDDSPTPTGYGVSDAVYQALMALRAAVIADIAQRGANLARLVGYTPAITLPALVIAYRLYGDASRDAELVTRNRVVHPGFVPGGASLEVLNG